MLKRLIVLLSLLAPCTMPFIVPSDAAAGLESIPGYDRYQKVRSRLGELAVGGRLSDVEWSEDGTTLTYRRGEQLYRVDLATGEISAIPEGEITDDEASRDRPPRRRGPGRGRQRDRETSPDGEFVAVSRDWNVYLERGDGEPMRSVSTDGHRKLRYGTASWVYGEELSQRDAMWWSPDGRFLVFYRFDEREVPDYHLLGNLTERFTTVLSEGYPKPGDPNPVVGLMVHDVETGETRDLDVGPDPDQYVYRVQFAPTGSTLLFSRTNRRQNVLDLVAADVETGAMRIVLTEQQETWQDNRPDMRFLDDGERFIWATERTGWKQYELRHLDGTRIATLTYGEFPVLGIERVDEERDVLFYLAAGGESPLNTHLYRVGLDGSDQRRLTQEASSHSVRLSPDARHFITTYEAVDTPPATALYDTEGTRLATLGESDVSAMKALGLSTPELFEFTAVDGETPLYGALYKPADFDPTRRYPLVVRVYGGPFSTGLRNRFSGADAICELGFLVARLENRGTVNRGKAFEAATYLRLGTVDLQDQVEGVRHLTARPYVDGDRVGIAGHSYGGFMATLGVLRHPEVFHAAVGGSAVTDWRNYDSIYTERYMRTPEENADGYDEGSCLTYADQLTGRLLLLHGMIDDNVHPSNLWQLAAALQREGKPFDMMVYPDRGHSTGRAAGEKQWEYLYEALIEGW